MLTFYTPKIVLLNFRGNRDDFAAGQFSLYILHFFFFLYLTIMIIIILNHKQFAVIVLKVEISGIGVS